MNYEGFLVDRKKKRWAHSQHATLAEYELIYTTLMCLYGNIYQEPWQQPPRTLLVTWNTIAQFGRVVGHY